MTDCNELISIDDQKNAKLDADSIGEFVNSMNNTFQPRIDGPKRTIEGIINYAEGVVSSLGYVIVGDFADAPKVELTNPNQLYTSKSVANAEDAIWRYTGALPYTPTESAPTTDWVSVAQGELKAAALAAGTTYDNITYSNNLVDEIKGYIFDATKQITYAVPEAAQGGLILDFTGRVLETGSGIYILRTVSEDKKISRWKAEGDLRGWAVGDWDVETNTGTDDTDAILLAASESSYLFIPNGYTFRFARNEPITATEGLSVVGSGEGSAISVSADVLGGYCLMSNPNAVNSVSLLNFKIIGDDNERTSSLDSSGTRPVTLLNLDNCDGLKFDNVIVEKWWAYYAYGEPLVENTFSCVLSNHNSKNGVFTNSKFIGCGNEVIAANNHKDGLFDSLEFYNNTQSTNHIFTPIHVMAVNDELDVSTCSGNIITNIMIRDAIGSCVNYCGVDGVISNHVYKKVDKGFDFSVEQFDSLPGTFMTNNSVSNVVMEAKGELLDVFGNPSQGGYALNISGLHDGLTVTNYVASKCTRRGLTLNGHYINTNLNSVIVKDMVNMPHLDTNSPLHLYGEYIYDGAVLEQITNIKFNGCVLKGPINDATESQIVRVKKVKFNNCDIDANILVKKTLAVTISETDLITSNEGAHALYLNDDEGVKTNLSVIHSSVETTGVGKYPVLAIQDFMGAVRIQSSDFARSGTVDASQGMIRLTTNYDSFYQSDNTTNNTWALRNPDAKVSMLSLGSVDGEYYGYTSAIEFPFGYMFMTGAGELKISLDKPTSNLSGVLIATAT